MRLAPHKVYLHQDRPTGQWNEKKKFCEAANGIVASAPQQLTKIQRRAQLI
jgi:hypothetical protein